MAARIFAALMLITGIVHLFSNTTTAAILIISALLIESYATENL